MVAATMADVFMPFFAGRLVDALTLVSADRDAAGYAALTAFGAMVALGAGMVVLRHLGWSGIIPLTLRMMRDVSQDAFHRVQRLSTDWHANSFAGAVVRKVTRGMWALDTLDDTLAAGAAALGHRAARDDGAAGRCTGRCWGWSWRVGAVAYIALTLYLSTAVVAPAARLSNALDTRLGGMLADAIGCNAVVKAFGAEAREDERLARTVAKWRSRTRRTWTRHTCSGTDAERRPAGDADGGRRHGAHGCGGTAGRRPATSPTCSRPISSCTAICATSACTSTISSARSTRWRSWSPSTTSRSGSRTARMRKPIRIDAGEIRFERVAFRYGAHAVPLYQDLSVTIGAGERVGLVGPSGSGKTTFVKLIQRLYDATGGRVLIDGQDVGHATQASLRSRIAIVPQEPVLFHRSLAENIAYARPGAISGGDRAGGPAGQRP